jgi:hypothetical protein
VNIFNASDIKALVYKYAFMKRLGVESFYQMPSTRHCPEVYSLPGIHHEHIDYRAVISLSSDAPGVRDGLFSILLGIEDR